MAIFQKNITSKMDENGLKYTSRTNLHFDIGLGWLVHEKIFTAAKLRFLAGQASLLDEASTGTQNWSVRAMPTSIQSISVISQTFRPFLVIWGLPGQQLVRSSFYPSRRPEEIKNLNFAAVKNFSWTNQTYIKV